MQNKAPKKPLPVAVASGPTQKKSLALIQAMTFNDVPQENGTTGIFSTLYFLQPPMSSNNLSWNPQSSSSVSVFFF